MGSKIRSVVIKTPKLEATRHFFEKVLHLPVKESSMMHFVLHSKDIRLLFLATKDNFGLEIYIEATPEKTIEKIQQAALTCVKDPNGIRIVRVSE